MNEKIPYKVFPVCNQYQKKQIEDRGTSGSEQIHLVEDLRNRSPLHCRTLSQFYKTVELVKISKLLRVDRFSKHKESTHLDYHLKCGHCDFVRAFLCTFLCLGS